MKAIKFRGLLLNVVDIRTGWVHRTDPEEPGVIHSKESIVEILSGLRQSVEVEELVKGLLRLRGVGPKTVNGWLKAAGWRAGYVKISEE